MSYYEQIDIVNKINPNTILEIWVSNKTVYNYLKNQEFDIDSCDFNESVEPDYVSDIRELSFDDSSYDVVLCSQVLEHLPWEDVNKALQELYRVSKRKVIISVPYSSLQINFGFTMSMAKKILNKHLITFLFRLPAYFIPINVDICDEHFWEMGNKRQYSKNKFIKKIKEIGFNIEEEKNVKFNPQHHFFILNKN